LHGCLFIFLIFIHSCASNPIKYPPLSSHAKGRIEKNLQKIIQQLNDGTNLGLSIVSMRSGDLIYASHAEKLFLPASVIKLYTAAAALHYLTPSFRYQTNLTTDAFDRKKQMIHNLILKGSGDPSFKSEDLRSLVNQIKQQKIKTITGDIIIDISIFDDVGWAKGWMWDDLHRGFSAPIYGLNIDSNQVILQLKSNHQVKVPLQITANSSSYFSIENYAYAQNSYNPQLELLVKSPYSKQFEIWPKAHEYGLDPGSIIRITGNLGLRQTKYLKLALSDPMQFAAQIILDELKKHNIKVSSRVRIQRTMQSKTSSQIILASHTSRQLSEALIDFMKISNDHALESLVKTIPAVKNPNQAASFEEGLGAINTFLINEVGLAPNSFRSADGSGTSRYNLVSAAQTTQLLEYIYHKFSMSPELLASLAFQDGTLTQRFNGELAKRVRAKTGFLSNVYGLAGFIDVSNDILAFAIFSNGSLEGSFNNFALQERILSALLP